MRRLIKHMLLHLIVWREEYQNCSVYYNCTELYAHSYKQFLQVNKGLFVYA